MDHMEENSPLFITEYNFRRIVKLHLEDLLPIECNYWRKRCTIQRIKMGEDNAKFFHAMTTTRFRRNSVVMLKGMMAEWSLIMRKGWDFVGLIQS